MAVTPAINRGLVMPLSMVSSVPALRVVVSAQVPRRPRQRPGSPSEVATLPWGLAAADGCDTEACLALLDGLAEMPRAAWLEIGRAESVRDAGQADDDGSAAEVLEATLVVRRLAVSAWFVRDAVETAVEIAQLDATTARRRSAARPPCTRTERVLLARAQRAAERAALARLARPWLAPDTFARLVAPFAGRLAAAESAR